MDTPIKALAAACVLTAASAAPARADEPITLRTSWRGALDFFATGAPMAIDGPDADTTRVDTVLHPARVTVRPEDIPAQVQLVQAFLYWSGTIQNTECFGDVMDHEVTLAPPGGTPLPVAADTCVCSDAGVAGYDVQSCRADVTDLLGAAPIAGTYAVDDFAAAIQNRTTDNASFSLVFVYGGPALPPRRVALYDGIETMFTQVGGPVASRTLSLDGLQVDDPPQGDLTWYVLEGDTGGTGAESVNVLGTPGARGVTLTDAVNPPNNPMNHTINTIVPPATDTIGADIDRFDLAGALSPGDRALDVTYQAGTDKFWIVYNIVGVNVFVGEFAPDSTKTGVLLDDADRNGVPSPGDTVRYTLHLENTGRAPGTVALTDVLSPVISAWELVDDGGGRDVSDPGTVGIEGLTIAPGGSADVVFDAVIADVPDGTVLSNVATFDATPNGDSGAMSAEDLVVRRDGDADGVFDADDNCPDDANPDQTDSDADGEGDVCCPGFGRPDLCDGLDSDCDARVDEDAVVGGPCPTGLPVGCETGAIACRAGAEICVIPDRSGVSEACNGLDDDCDGLVDDGVLNRCGACGPEPAEVCNGDDDDCDGETDEGVLNRCGACGPEPAEVCNGDDDDCDGETDEGVLNRCGACGPEPAEVCNGADDDCDGETDEGVQNRCGACGPEPAEACNGLDDDCNGETDEGLGGLPCNSGQPGICTTGRQVCAEGAFVCRPLEAPRPEACNGVDDDCDGAFDEEGACDPCRQGGEDTDGDGHPDADRCDNCLAAANPDQADADGDGVGDACDLCPDALDPDQEDGDGDGLGDRCDLCPASADPDQLDTDDDGLGDACDLCPDGADPAQRDGDADGVGDACDVCPGASDPEQADTDADGAGDACDTCPDVSNPHQADADTDGIGDACDNCPLAANEDQADADGDGTGDACAVACPGAGQPDLCNGQDDDCDGETDEDAVRAACDTGEVGVCAAGVDACDERGCVPEVASAEETCNGLDDDCDGAIDEDLRNACHGCGEPPAEQCNGRDDDCDGVADDDATCPEGQGCLNGRCRARCETNECGEDLACVDGLCQDACARVVCGPNEVCDPDLERCVDPCEGVDCPADGEVCRRGACGPADCRVTGCPDGFGCLGDTCVDRGCRDVSCEAGAFCRDGECVGTCAEVSCGFGQQCVDGACQGDPCATVVCAEGEACAEGTCGPDPCAGVTCEAGFRCQDAACVPHPCGAVECPQGLVCELRAGRPQCLLPEQSRDPYTPSEPPSGGGEPDAGPGLDAGPGFDAGPPQPDACAAGVVCEALPETGNGPGTSESCNCRTGRPGSAGPLLAALAVLGLRLRRRRRH